MGKLETRFEHYNLARVFAKPTKPAFLTGPINGWDTETSGNEVVALSVAFEDRPGQAIHADTAALDSVTVFDWLTNRRARSACNVWYNLDFDINVILAHLPKHVVYHISVFGADTWNGLEISYLRKKLFRIKDAHRNQYNHYDVSQFFFGSLDKALQQWLGRKKRNELVDVKRFTDREYLREHWSDILDYARADAEDVRDLWRKFVETAEPLDIPCGKPYSTGFLAEQTYNVQFQGIQSKPSFVNHEIQAMAWASYFGGRFEIRERGEVGHVTVADINSAYPNVLRDLPDPGTLRWREVKRPNWDALESADYGFIRAVVTTDPARPFQPFAIRERGALTFPALEAREITATLPEFLFAVRSGIVTDYVPINSWLARATRNTLYPFKFVDALYEERQRLKAAGEDKKQQVLKIIINSLYGKLAQLTEITERTPYNAEWRKHWLWYPIEVFPPHMREWLESENIEIHKTVKAGAYFNPFLASYITGMTRLQLLETVVNYGLESETVVLATDSIGVRTEAFQASDFARKVGGSDLGAWDVEAAGDLFLVGSGVYELTTDDGRVKAATRGFEPGFGVYGLDLDGATLREAAGAAVDDPDRGSIIPISTTRPLKINQALWQGFDLVDVGVFREFPRGLSAAMDKKRIWARGKSVTWHDLLSGKENSKPLRG